MGESACRLRRSFSSPSTTSYKAIEASLQETLDSLQGESVSLGRFMSETLAWEKWSAFSQNRHLEEAKKFSKPGSVAEKRAYFEAYYKGTAAKKAKTTAYTTPQFHTTEQSHDNPVEMVNDLTKNTENSSSILGHVVVEEAKSLMRETVIQVNRAQENSDTHDKLVAWNENSTPEKEEAVKSSGEPIVSSPKSLHCDRASNARHSFIPEPPIPPRNRASLTRKETDLSIDAEIRGSFDAYGRYPDVQGPKKYNAVVEETKSVIPITAVDVNYNQVDHFENVDTHDKHVVWSEKNTPTKVVANQEILALEENNVEPTATSLKSSNRRRASKRHISKLAPPRLQIKENHVALNSKPVGEESVDRTRATSKSNSLLFGSGTGETNKIFSHLENPSLASLTNKMRNPRISTTSAKMSTQASASAVSYHSSIAPASESESYEKSSGASEKKSRTTTVCTPFRFRSDERAEKRKEFFEKLEEKKKKEAGKTQFQRKSKETTDNNLRKTSCTFGFNPNVVMRAGSSINPMTKVQLTVPKSPKLTRKLSPFIIHDRATQPHRKPSMRRSRSKYACENINPEPAGSVTAGNTPGECFPPNIKV